MRIRGHGNAIAIALAGLAVVLAASGTAYAVTATTVNIADPTTPSRIAHVDSTGRLATAGVLSTLNSVQYVPPVNNRVALTDPTVASIAITRVAYTNPAANLGSSDVNFQLTIAKYNVGASGQCTGTDATLASTISRQATAPNTSAEGSYALPYVVKATGTTKYCIAASAAVYGTLPGTYYYPTVQLTGYVASGTYTGVGSAASPAVLSGKAGTVR